MNYSFIFFGIFGIWFNTNYGPNEHKKSEKIAFNKFVNKTDELLLKKFDITLIALGSSSDSEGISLVSFTFSRQKGVLSRDDGRVMIIEIISEILSSINNDEKLKPFLSNVPFEPKNLEIIVINSLEKMVIFLIPILKSSLFQKILLGIVLRIQIMYIGINQKFLNLMLKL